MEDAAKLVDALKSFIVAVGFGNTIGCCVFAVAAWAGWTIYKDRRERQDTRDVLKDKEESIQRLNEENREYRYFFMLKSGMSEEEIKAIRHLPSAASPLTPDQAKVAQLPTPRMKKRRKA